ncbi:MAG: carboxypeptidase-like regulatory domain-containing protein [Gemmatimonadetes bacterium]|nr:carboxypeptidase-like regulatory domain-containing protein [Gemmatimonadota bacterium]
MRRAAFVLVLALMRTLPATGQVVRGVVLEETAGRPIEGAMVVVMDGEGHVAARILTDAAGRFVTKLPQPGAYRVRVDRIGYTSVTTDPFDVPGAGTFRRILVPIHPVELAGLDVSGAKRCEVRPEVGRATAIVWEEARKALEAAAWTLETDRYRYQLLHFVRYLDRDGRRTLEEYRNFSINPGRQAYVSRAAEELADSGYVQELVGGKLSYFAPDAEVLLSDSFLDTHCMKLEKGEDGLVGLAFEPVKGRKLPEIRGVLWMDATTAILTRLEYRYTNLGRGPAAGDAGGEVRFGHLPAGTWIVREWHIRMPLFQRSREHRYLRTGYQEEGGVVWRVTDDSGAVVQEAIKAAVKGHVVDSLGAPLSGATVTPRGLDARAVSDVSGDFLLGDLPEGLLRLDFGVPYLDTLGLRVSDAPEVLRLAEGDTVTLRRDVRVPGVQELLSGACGGKRPDGTAILFGRVRDDAGPAGDAKVTLSLGAPTMTDPSPAHFRLNPRAAPMGGPGQRPTWARVSGPNGWIETTLDARGIFLFCDVPVGTQVRVAAESAERSAEATVDIPRGSPVVVTTLTIPPDTVGGRR